MTTDPFETNQRKANATSVARWLNDNPMPTVKVYLCDACGEIVPDNGEHPAAYQCSNPKCGIWYHEGDSEWCPNCGGPPNN